MIVNVSTFTQYCCQWRPASSEARPRAHWVKQHDWNEHNRGHDIRRELHQHTQTSTTVYAHVNGHPFSLWGGREVLYDY